MRKAPFGAFYISDNLFIDIPMGASGAGLFFFAIGLNMTRPSSGCFAILTFPFFLNLLNFFSLFIIPFFFRNAHRRFSEMLVRDPLFFGSSFEEPELRLLRRTLKRRRRAAAIRLV
jgi:hypothetical protein